MNKIKLLITVIALSFSNAKGQAPTLQWAKQLGGTSSDAGYSIRADGAGNVYTAGYFQGTADFDPGPGTFNLTSAGSWDIFVSKVDASGNFLWARAMGGSGTEVGNSITMDGSGNILITGFFDGTSDFDPGPGVFNLTSAGNSDIFISKLDASGNFVWAKKMGGTGNDYGYSVAVDAAGDVYTTGFFNLTVDFDPNGGVFNLTSLGIGDIFISKVDASGNFVWAKKIGGASNDVGYSIAIDAGGNIYSTGIFIGTVDFDPGAGVFSLTSSGSSDIFISKLDASGNFVWAKQLGGSMNDYGYAITVDNSGNIYTTGDFNGTADFDPGAGTFNFVSFGSDDIFVSKLDASGNFVWAKQMGGVGFENGLCITTDPVGNVYTTGYYQATSDFDPGPGTYTLSASGSNDIFITKLNSSGNFVWAITMGSATADVGRSIALDAVGNIYTTGYFTSMVDFDPGPGTFNLTSVGNDEIFIQKLNQCIIPAQPGIINGATSLCAGAGLGVYSVSPVFGATSYTWSLPAGWSGSSSTNSISATPGSSGIFTLTASSVCGTSPQQTLNVTVNPLPTITVNSGSICSGQLFTITPGGASTYTFQGGSSVVSPTSTTSYTVVGTSTAGCVSSSFATSNVTVNDLPIVTVNSGSICSGNSFTIVASGANTYTFSGGPIVTPTITSSYSVTGTSTAGCVSSSAAIANVTVNPLPTINVSTSNTMLCIGQSATLMASGALSYTFNPGGAGTSIVVSPSITSTYTINGTDVNGCANSSSFTQSVSACTGINQIANSVSEVQVYPNPFNNKITVVSNSVKLPVLIFNALGSLIYKTEMENEKIEIDFSKESSGIYFIKIGTETKKIVKE